MQPSLVVTDEAPDFLQEVELRTNPAPKPMQFERRRAPRHAFGGIAKMFVGHSDSYNDRRVVNPKANGLPGSSKPLGTSNWLVAGLDLNQRSATHLLTRQARPSNFVTPKASILQAALSKSM